MSFASPLDDGTDVVPQPTSMVLRQGLRLVARSWRLRPLRHLIATTGAVVYALASIALTVVLGRITDRVVVPGIDEGSVARSTVWLALMALLIVGACRAAGAMLRRWFLSSAEYGTQQVWRTGLSDRYLDLPMEFHHRVPAGRLLAHTDADVEASTRMLKPLAFAIGTLVLAVVALISLLRISPWLVLVAAVLFPALSLMNRVYTERVSVPAQRERSENGRVSAIAHESFDGALVIKTLGRERHEVQRLDTAARSLRDTRIEIGRMRALFEPAIEALPNLGIVALLGLGAWLVDRGDVTIGGLVEAMSLFTILAVPVRVVGFFLEEMPSSVAALARVDTVLNEPLPDESAAAAPLPGNGPIAVDLEGVTFSHPAVPGESEAPNDVLRNLHLRINPGESVAIVGSTGSGKTTLAHLIARLIDPQSGTVRLDGVDARHLSDDDRTSAVSVVFQEAFLFAESVRQNLTLGGDVSDQEVRRVLALAHAEHFVDDMPEGLETVVGERGVTLSGGQRQRIALARALLRRPRLLILDDATSAVDPTVERNVLDALRGDLETTLVVIAYRLATIRLADRVVYLADGVIAADGTHDELMQNADYRALITAYEE